MRSRKTHQFKKPFKPEIVEEIEEVPVASLDFWNNMFGKKDGNAGVKEIQE
jgi:hypothetical protein